MLLDSQFVVSQTDSAYNVSVLVAYSYYLVQTEAAVDEEGENLSQEPHIADANE